MTWRSVGDRCTDIDGDVWEVVVVDDDGMAGLVTVHTISAGWARKGWTQTGDILEYVADRWGPLLWSDGSVTPGNSTDDDNDAGRDH